MHKLIIFLLFMLVSFCTSEMLQYCSDSPGGYDPWQCIWHRGQVMTPSYNQGTITSVSVYSTWNGSSSWLYRKHRIELWRYDGQLPYGKFFETDVTVTPSTYTGWTTTAVNTQWNGDYEDSFVAVFQGISLSGGSAWIESHIAIDGSILEPNRNWYTNSSEVWAISTYGDFMFRIVFTSPYEHVVESNSLGRVKSMFR